MKSQKTKKIEQIEAQQILTAAKSMKLETVVDDLGKFQIGFQNIVAELSANMTNNIKRFSDIETAIALNEQRLKELYEIEKEATKLEEIKTQIANAEMVFAETQKLNQKLADEEAAERKKNWLREEEEHKYIMDNLRKKSLVEHEAMVAANKREEAIRKADLERSWLDRETKLQSQEQEVTSLRTQVASIPNTIKAKMDEAYASAKSEMSQKHNYEMAVLKKELETQKELSNAKISAMSEAMQKLEHQIEELNKQLMEARKDSKEIAAQALQSASGRQVADALAKVVDSKNETTAKK